MIEEKLKEIKTNNYNKFIFFLKDFIYHSAFNNIINLPKIFEEEFDVIERKKVDSLLLVITKSDNKDSLLKELNDIIYKKSRPKKEIKKKAEKILNELSKTIQSEEIDNITTELAGFVEAGKTDIFRPLSSTARFGSKHLNVRKLVKRRHGLKKQGIKHPFTIRVKQKDEVIIREITLRNGVKVKVVIDENDFSKFNYAKPVISNSALDLIIKQNRSL